MKDRTTFLTVAMVAEALNVSERSVRRWLSEEKLSVHKFGRAVRISKSDLEEFIRRSK